MSLSERASFGELFLEVISGREVTLRVCAGANDCGFDNAVSSALRRVLFLRLPVV